MGREERHLCLLRNVPEKSGQGWDLLSILSILSIVIVKLDL